MKNKKVYLVLIMIIICFVTSYFLYVNINGESKHLKIELIGDEEVIINYKEEYKDSGVKASYKDNDLTKKVEVLTNVNFDKLGTYYYKYTVRYQNLSKTVTRNIKIIDLEKPVITLNGSDTIYINTNSKYEELGASVNDNYDKDIIEKLKITNNVNTKVPGEYKAIYEIEDSSHNKSTIERKIIVRDKEESNYSKEEYNSNETKVIGSSTKGYTIEVKNGIYYVNNILVVNKTYPLPSSYNPGLLNDFLSNFTNMQKDASKEGINLNVVSGFRSYSYQKNLYNNYVKKDGVLKADRYSARAGHSEHQSGLAADINLVSQSFKDTKEGIWLNKNCYKYGFIIRYPKDKENETGYIYEPWHIRYVGSTISKDLYNDGNWISLEEYLGITSKY